METKNCWPILANFRDPDGRCLVLAVWDCDPRLPEADVAFCCLLGRAYNRAVMLAALVRGGDHD